MKSTVVWMDIPVKDLDRAIAFYSAVLDSPVSKSEYTGGAIGILPHDNNQSIGGCLYQSETDQPSDHGPLVYFNCDGRLDQAIAAAGKNSGKVLQEKHAIPPHGFRAIVLDSEGNRIALHTM